MLVEMRASVPREGALPVTDWGGAQPATDCPSPESWGTRLAPPFHRGHGAWRSSGSSRYLWGSNGGWGSPLTGWLPPSLWRVALAGTGQPLVSSLAEPGLPGTALCLCVRLPHFNTDAAGSCKGDFLKILAYEVLRKERLPTHQGS